MAISTFETLPPLEHYRSPCGGYTFRAKASGPRASYIQIAVFSTRCDRSGRLRTRGERGLGGRGISVRYAQCDNPGGLARPRVTARSSRRPRNAKPAYAAGDMRVRRVPHWHGICMSILVTTAKRTQRWRASRTPNREPMPRDRGGGAATAPEKDTACPPCWHRTRARHRTRAVWWPRGLRALRPRCMRCSPRWRMWWIQTTD